MDEELINLAKIKKMLQGKSGKTIVEVADTEYDHLLKEAQKDNAVIDQKKNEFSLKAGDAIICIQKDE